MRTNLSRRLLLLPRLSAVLFGAVSAGAQPRQPVSDSVGQSWTYDGQLGRYRVEIVATGVSVPWGLAFLPDGRALVTDRRPARLLLLDVKTGAWTPVQGTPAVHDSVDGGLLDVALHPDYARNGWIYYAFTEKTDSGKTTVVERARLRGTRLADRQRLFAAFPTITGDSHFGSRLVVKDGYLYVAIGDRHIGDLAQELWTDAGKIVRLRDDGRVPPDNPFVGRPGARPEIWSYGHRNPHGLAVHPETGELWEHEHGPLGGDEVNVIRRGANYGWPIVSYGREYDGGPVGDGLTQRDGTEQPLHHWATSIAPSGLTFYTGNAFPPWRGSLFMGAMTPRYLGRIVVTGGRAREERLLTEKRWRIRVVQQGPDGYLYLGVERAGDGSGGTIARVRPE